MIDGLSWRRMIFAGISPQDLVEDTGTGASPGTIKLEFHRARDCGRSKRPAKPAVSREVGAVGEGKKAIGGHRFK
ncbi:hypothetical protein FRC17_008428 [Serendipita sp. 399]|nr:hypothetical protein FRC17_008428 [Serendipita sp. 399]